MIGLRKLPKSKKFRLIIALVGLVVIGGTAYQVLCHKHGSKAVIKGQTVSFSTTTPDETPIDKLSYDWQGADDEPRYINLPSIKATGYVQRVAVDQNGAIAVPDNINFAGWYINSAKPGAKGLSIIDGHLNGLRYNGIFIHLDKMKVGDKFNVELGNHKLIHYEVISSKIVPTEAAVNQLFSQDSRVDSQLNLITCVGKYDSAARQYDHRIIVAGKLLEH